MRIKFSTTSILNIFLYIELIQDSEKCIVNLDYAMFLNYLDNFNSYF